MNRRIQSALFVLLALASASCAAAGLTQASVQAMFDDMQSSIQKHDADALLSWFANDAKITIVLPESAGGTMHLSPDQYKAMLEQSWQAQSSSSYETSDVVIIVAADGKSAVATDTTRETAEIFGQTITAVAKERAEIVLRNGEPKITALTAVAR